MDDCELLRAYQERRSEPAFTELVERHLGLVYSVALRVVREPSAAQDVAQAVFIQLARRPWTARPRGSLAGWLYRATRCDALDAVRRETRRHQRESEAMNLATMNSSPEIVPDQIAPLLEEAMGHLRRDEQDAVVLRFYEGKTLRETGALLALSEDAARKRVDRALDKMRAHFARAGITASAALLTSALTAHAAEPPPAGLAAKVAGASVANAAAGSGAGGLIHALMKVLFMNTVTKMALMGVVAAGAAYTVGQWHADAQYASSAKASNRIGQNARSAPNAPAGFYQSSGKLTREEGLARLKAILATPNGIISSWFILIPELNVEDIPYLIDQISTLPRSDDRDYAIAHLLLSQENPDPVAAIALVSKITSVTNVSNGMNDIYIFMVRQEPSTVLAELAGLPDGQMAQDIYHNIFLSWAAGDNSSGRGAAALALSLPPGARQQKALNTVATGWARQDPVAALAWAGSLPPEDSTAMKNALIEANDKNPNLAAQYVDKLTDAAARNQIVGRISLSMSQHDPAAALDWLDQEATGDNYDNSVVNIFAALAKNDPASATTLLDKVNDPTVRQTVISNLTTAWAKTNLPAALAWLQSLPESDAVARDANLQKLVATQTAGR